MLVLLLVLLVVQMVALGGYSEGGAFQQTKALMKMQLLAVQTAPCSPPSRLPSLCSFPFRLPLLESPACPRPVSASASKAFSPRRRHRSLRVSVVWRTFRDMSSSWAKAGPSSCEWRHFFIDDWMSIGAVTNDQQLTRALAAANALSQPGRPTNFFA